MALRAASGAAERTAMQPGSTCTEPGRPDRQHLTRQGLLWSVDMLGMILLIVLIVLLLGAVPRWPHSRNWGYAPSGILSVILIIVIILLLMNRI